MADDNVFHFPPRRDGAVPPPPLPPVPRPSTPAADAPTGRQEEAPADDAMPRMPDVKPMSVPVALMMPPPPPLPAGDSADDLGDDRGAFAPPSPEDPTNPTGRETLQICMAILTAMGVAAAQGMWHRARQRQARADMVRAQADKAAGKVAAHGSGSAGGGRGGSKGGGGLLTGSRQEPAHRRRHGGSHPGGQGRGRKGPKDTHRSPGGRPPGAGGKGGSHGPHGGSHKAPKSTRDGKSSGDDHGARKRRKRGAIKGGLDAAGPCVKNRKLRKPGDKALKATKDGKRRAPGTDPAPKKRPAPLKWKAGKKSGPGPEGDRALPPGRKRWKRTKPGATGGTRAPKRRKRRGKRRSWLRWKSTPAWLKRWRNRHKTATNSWKAPRKNRPGPGGDKALSPGRKRWKRTRPGTGTRGSTGGKGKRRIRRPRWLRWKSTPAWLMRWRTRHKATAASSPGATDGRASWGRSTPPPPPPGFGWMRPPPGADRSTRVTTERVDQPVRRKYEPDPAPSTPAVAGATRLALPVPPAADAPEFRRPAGPAPASDDSPAATPAASAPTVPTPTNGAQMNPLVPAPRATTATGTQYRDADLTIYDVIEADADAAEEITEGVYEAQATAHGCERLMTKLEDLHASIVELKVPGVLEGMLLRLIEKTGTVKAKAEAIAANLPAASEAIAIAGTNAAARHKGLADAVRDAGHIRPAEREYHQE
ncbi:hypothetical protein EDD27_1467 [Nonomuraea polychroma]|uniref:Uncharacterized protein n=1 Tax=Nonomuraea polychroma TaxID=46176 RepID=A0A438LZX8_9ACTN|nr:hypothetical protein [Nonomuraea polychroma]RVX39124.1 hypothetical protein EDD27_1467 [Nonomuraea polychroma]